MGKLADLIRQARSGGGRPMGFGAARGRAAGPAGGLVIAAVGDAPNGADLLVRSVEALDARSLAPIVAKAAVPLGIETPTIDRAALNAAQEAGVDFVLAPLAGAMADALTPRALDCILRIDPAAPAETLRALGTLRVALLALPALPVPLSVEAVVQVRRVAMLSGLPLAVPVSPDLEAGSLEALRDAGVALLLVDGPTPDQAAALRERIAALPSPERRRDRAAVLLPGTSEPADDEDDDDQPDHFE